MRLKNSPIQDLDTQSVQSIVQMRDEVGILAIYMGVSSEDAGASWSRESRIEIENQLRDRSESVRAYGDHGYQSAFEQCVDDVKPLITSVSAAAEGRGRAIFCGLESGEVVQIRSDSWLPNVVRVGPSAHILPLLVALEEGRPFGVVALHRDEARVFGFKYGSGTEIIRLSLEPDSGDWRDMSGPAFSSPGSSQVSVSLRDDFDDRLMANIARSIGGLAGAAAETTAAEGWDLLVVSGDPRLTNEFERSFAPAAHRVRLVRDEHVWGDSSAEEVGRRTAPLVEQVRREDAAALASKIVEDSAFEGQAVVGLNDTLNALSAGRVRVLVFDSDLYDSSGGSVDADRLNQAVKDGLAAGVEVIPLSGKAAQSLAGAVAAAQLYW